MGKPTRTVRGEAGLRQPGGIQVWRGSAYSLTSARDRIKKGESEGEDVSNLVIVDFCEGLKVSEWRDLLKQCLKPCYCGLLRGIKK